MYGYISLFSSHNVGNVFHSRKGMKNLTILKNALGHKELSHGSPPTSDLLTPISYLYYYIRLLMSLISLFFFALTFG
jgi:hypothetical protein